VEANEDFREYAAFAANSLIFLLIGMRLANQERLLKIDLF
jgi:NhaP-type Na+/H+ or K+/H+ antiporter